MGRGFLLSGLMAASLAITAPLHPAKAADRVAALGLHANGAASRLTLDLSGPVGYAIRQIDGGIVIDVTSLDWQVPLLDLQQPFGTLIKSVAFQHPAGTVPMIIVATTSPAQVARVDEIAPSGGDHVTRLQLDLIARPPEAALPPTPPPTPPAPVPSAAAPIDPSAPVAVAAPPAAPTHIPVLVIDPGHGGSDLGKTGAGGAHEKDIVLAIARLMKARLDRDGKVTTYLTRDQDVSVPISGRAGIARARHADLFIGLRANSNPDASLHGLAAFSYAEAASSPDAQSTADQDASPPTAGADESAAVGDILLDLVQRETGGLSSRFAAMLTDQVDRELHDLSPTPQGAASFAILKALGMPSIVVETGYLSNRNDERDLRDPKFRGRLADALAHAVETYFAQIGSEAVSASGTP